MLSHGNIFSQLAEFEYFVKPVRGEQTLSLLPPWHIYERTVGYYIFSRGCKQVILPTPPSLPDCCCREPFSPF